MEDHLTKMANLIASERYEEAIRILRPEVKAGRAWAESFMGLLHYTGSGVPRNYELAERLLTSAAHKGDGMAAHNLGSLIMERDGVDKGMSESKKWYRLAKKLGFQMTTDDFYH